MDHVQPLLWHHSNDGGGWRAHGISETQVMKRHARNRLGFETIGAYQEQLIRENMEKGNLQRDIS